MQWAKPLNYLPICLTLCFALTACDRSEPHNSIETKHNKLRVGVTTSPNSALTDQVALIAQQKHNLTVEFINFSNFSLPNEALNSKELDANAFQHLPFLEQQIKDHGYRLTAIGKTFIYPLTAYSKKITSLQGLQQQDKVAIPDDPTNLSRALRLLQQAGLITLRHNTGFNATQLDITHNPLNLEIIEIEAPQLISALDDPKIALAIINAVFAAQAGLSPAKDGLIIEDKSSPYVNIIAARVDNQHDERLQHLIEAYHDPSVVQKADELFNGNALPGW